MKYTLLLDSSTTLLCVGLANEDHVLESKIYECWQAQSEHMIPEINVILEKYKVCLSDISCVMVAVGPGSYTGVRIAITIAKTLAAALKCDVIPVSSLNTLKDGGKKSICLINARSGRSYFSVYENKKALVDDCIMSNDDVLKYINEHPDYSICGQVAYLGLKGVKTNSIDEMFSLKNELAPIENPLALKPVYMKD